jgi:hypothetical protein
MSYNIGSILNLWALPPEKVGATYVKPDFSLVDIFISQIDTNNYKIPCIQESIIVETEQDDDDGCGLWVSEIKGSIPKITATERAYINLLNAKCIIVVENVIRNFYLFGLKKSPMTPNKIKRINPNNVANATKFDFSVSGSHPHQPPMIRSKFNW